MYKKRIFTWLSAAMMFVMVGASVMPVLTAFAVTNTRSEDLIFQKDSTGNVVAILSKNGLITPIGDVQVVRDTNGTITGIKTIYGEVVAISGASYTLPVATSSVLGGIKPDQTTIIVNASGVASASGTGSTYTLPTASTSVLGGVKVDGTSITIASGVISSASGSSGVTSVGTIDSQTKAANGAVISGAVVYMQTATSAVPGLQSASDKAKADATLAVSGTPATNDTFIYNGTNIGLVSHPSAQSSAATTFTLSTSWINTLTPNLYTGASDAVATVPLAASMVVAVGDEILLTQSGVGAVTASGVSATVNIYAEGNKKTTNGQYATMILKYLGSNNWLAVGQRK